MTKISSKSTKAAIYQAYCEIENELQKTKQQLRPKPSLCDVISHNLKDAVLADHIKTVVAYVLSYLIYAYVAGEFVNNKLTDAIHGITKLTPINAWRLVDQSNPYPFIN